MRIEIDTKKDSVDDIKKTIDFLLKFVSTGENQAMNDDTPIVNEGTFNIFGDTTNEEAKKEEDEDEKPMTIVEY